VRLHPRFSSPEPLLLSRSTIEPKHAKRSQEK
jgi:hypothetical protein